MDEEEKQHLAGYLILPIGQRPDKSRLRVHAERVYWRREENRGNKENTYFTEEGAHFIYKWMARQANVSTL